MKDNFSVQAGAYSQYRPYYPQEMTDYIISFVNNKDSALDVATGNGQVAFKLADDFKDVYATDISEKQLENAVRKENIQYSNQPAENTSFADGSFDLITVAQAIHWFDFDAFYKEVYRLLKPDGVFAVLGYGLFSAEDKDVDKLLQYFYHDITRPYWDAERRYLDEDYKTIPFPFQEMETKQFVNEFTWSFEQVTGYLETWSAVQHYIKKNGTNPVDLIRDELKEIWEKGGGRVTFPLLLRIGTLK